VRQSQKRAWTLKHRPRRRAVSAVIDGSLISMRLRNGFSVCAQANERITRIDAIPHSGIRQAEQRTRAHRPDPRPHYGPRAVRASLSLVDTFSAAHESVGEVGPWLPWCHSAYAFRDAQR